MNQKKSKLEKSALHIKNYVHIIKCPICQSSMKVVNFKSLICSHNHTYDIAKQGHINLLTHTNKSNYGKNLYSSRRKVLMESDLFKPFTKKVTKLINKYITTHSSIIDMGSGEGSHLKNICHLLESHYSKKTVGFGIDISREGILEAAKNYEGMIWLVADLVNSPFNNYVFDVILNILSPSNYEEFKRLLKNDGIILKIIPGPKYLQEIRHFFYHGSDQQEYTNKNVVNNFKNNFQVLDHSMMEYKKILNRSNLQALLQMTPLTWNIGEVQIRDFLQKEINEITVHLEILIGQKINRQ